MVDPEMLAHFVAIFSALRVLVCDHNSSMLEYNIILESKWCDTIFIQFVFFALFFSSLVQCVAFAFGVVISANFNNKKEKKIRFFFVRVIIQRCFALNIIIANNHWLPPMNVCFFLCSFHQLLTMILKRNPFYFSSSSSCFLHSISPNVCYNFIFYNSCVKIKRKESML